MILSGDFPDAHSFWEFFDAVRTLLAGVSEGARLGARPPPSVDNWGQACPHHCCQRACTSPALRYDESMAEEQGERPEWALRLRREREARRWSQADAVRALRTYADGPLPAGMLDQWKRWERGRSRPDEFYRPLIAATLGTVVESIFPTCLLYTSDAADE